MFFGKVIPAPSGNVRVSPLTVTLTVECDVVFTPSTRTVCR